MAPRHCQICLPIGRAALQWEGVRKPKCSLPHAFILFSDDLVIISSMSYNVPDIDIDKKTQSWLQKISGLNLSFTFCILIEVPQGEIKVSTFTQRENLMEKPGSHTRQE